MPTTPQPSTADTMAWGYDLKEISNIPGHEAGVQIIERPPGGSANPHYHPDGHEWVYCASGSMMLTIGDQPARELKSGDVAYLPANVVHFGRNVSDATVKLVLFRVKPVDQPMMVRA
jgi:quercetin dioxygenase-like cupin family protein